MKKLLFSLKVLFLVFFSFSVTLANSGIPSDSASNSPLVWVENNHHGLTIRGKFLTEIETAGFLKNKIEEAFIEHVQHSENVNFQFVNAGRKQRFIENLT